MTRTSSLFRSTRNNRLKRGICFFLILNLLIEIVSPTVAFALTSGPSSPEFSSFEPVATTDMVNDFSGDFTYNIPVLNVPGPDGGNYSMSLSYHSGSSLEEEASWVGHGWTLNAGAINRNKRGYPDDFKSVPVESYNKTKPNVNQSANFNINIEISSKDGKNDSNAIKKVEPAAKLVKKKFFLDKTEAPENEYEEEVSISFSKSIRYNNYSGFSIANSIGVSNKFGGLNMNSSAGQTTLGFKVNPLAVFKAVKNKVSKKSKETKKEKEPEETNGYKRVLAYKDPSTRKSWQDTKIKYPTSYTARSYNVPALAYSVAGGAGSSWNFNGSVVVNPANVPLGGQLGFQGNVTINANMPQEDKKAFGYLYSADANGYTNNPGNTDDQDNEFDYQVEKESTFDKHDKTIGIPFNNADNFSATGNGVIGGFRLQHPQIGTYYPTASLKTDLISQLGFEIGIGADFQIGFNVGVGANVTNVSGLWSPLALTTATLLPDFHKATFSHSDDAFMRFTNDMGGELNYNTASSATDIPHAKIDIIGNLITEASDFTLNTTNTNSKKVSGNSSGIKYEKTGDLITGIKITNKDGSKANYMQPVYTKNEAELTIGLPANKDGQYMVTNPLDYDFPLKNKTVVGSKTAQAYANSYLLTSNTTFNYVDINANNKVDDADFGGWTKFNYRKLWGDVNNNGNSDWYRYRTPYNGLMYNANRLIDKTDQTGSMSSGEKEVYYLKNVETKTHIAFFITNKTTMANDFKQADFPFLYDANTNAPLGTLNTMLNGSGTDRLDGLDAAGIDGTGKDMAAESYTAIGSHRLEKLERIVLFAKNDLSKPLTTTFFEYDNTVGSGIPNTTGIATNEKGKLTLKKVWTESYGVNMSQISPYIFSYEYYNNYPVELKNKYPWLTDFNLLPNNDARQNPQYKPWQLDPWGNNQIYGDVKFMNMQHWVSQTDHADFPSAQADVFDPAAWQLKRIQLPSGGEIHVHYEQKDYTSVQDQAAMAMVSLKYDGLVKNAYESDEATYKINVADLGIQNADVAAYAENLRKHFITERNKLYFKFLYSYSGDDQPELNTQNQRYDYVTGYVTVNEITNTATDIYLHLGDLRENIFGNEKGKKDKTLPRFVCYQQLASNGGNNLGLNAGSYKDKDLTDEIYTNSTMTGLALTGKVYARTFANTLNFSTNIFKDWLGGLIKNPKRSTTCTSLNHSMSYFKLPVYHAKKGGGIRVKRILTYDKGIQTGDAMLFGSEYSYVDKYGKSSGVATNEPGSMREENALVSYRERHKQKFIDKLLNGRDSKSAEGPLGENILPAAQVVHSRIVIRNIHSGKSTTGFAVNEYYTSKDFPMEAKYTDIKKKPGGRGTFKKFALDLPLGCFNMSINRAWITQGYLFKLNDMNGKIRSKSTYPGNYSQSFDESAYTSQTTYHYSQPGEAITTLVMNPAGNFEKQQLSAGTEQDYCMFSSNVSEISCDFNFEVDMNITILAIAPTFNASFSFASNALKQHSTSRVINQTSHLLSTTNITDGVAQTTENLGFDRYTGEPVLTRTFDGYVSNNKSIFTQNSGSPKHQGYYYSLNIPASWTYDAMKPIMTGGVEVNTHSNQLTANAGSIVTYSTNALYDFITNSVASNPWTPAFGNVVSASATTYTNNWFTAANLTDFVSTSTQSLLTTNVVNAANAFYYPLRSYSYKDNVVSANGVNGRIYNSGTIPNAFQFFNWANPSNPPSVWYSANKVTRYSPYGYPVEEEDVLNIKSTAMFGYGNTLPVSIAQNAAYKEILFLDFEYGPTSLYTDVTAHTGNRSFELSLPANQNYSFVPQYQLTTDMVVKRGVGVKFWLRSIASQNINNPNYGLKNPNPQVKVMIGTVAFNTKAIAQTGDWTLYSADIKSFPGLTPGSSYPVRIGYNYSTTTEQVFVDDFRIQPLDASMNCSVYYPDNKLAAQFDDQHFAVMYEYNNKGMLTRKSIETERGKKTLQEQQYNTPLINK